MPIRREHRFFYLIDWLQLSGGDPLRPRQGPVRGLRAPARSDPYSAWAMAGGGTLPLFPGATEPAGSSASKSARPTCSARSKRRGWCSPPRTGTMTRLTTARRTSLPSASAVTSCTISPSTSGGDGGRCSGGRLSATCFVAPTGRGMRRPHANKVNMATGARTQG